MVASSDPRGRNCCQNAALSDFVHRIVLGLKSKQLLNVINREHLRICFYEMCAEREVNARGSVTQICKLDER